MKISSIRNIFIVLILCLVGVSCKDNSTGANNSRKATFQGKVESGSSSSSVKSPGQARNVPSSAQSTSGVDGAVVMAATVQSNGKLKTIGSSKATTDAQGNYTLKVNVSGVNASERNKIVIVAKNSSGQINKAFVASKVKNGSTFTVQPIRNQSSAQVEVYQSAVANGNADEVSKAEIEVTVRGSVAADIENNTQYATNVAAALASSVKAKAKFYAQNGINMSSKKLQAIAKAEEKAEVKLQGKLNSATSVSEKQTAFNTFLKSVAKAEINAGVKAWAAAESDELAARMILQNSTSLSTSAQNALRQHAYFYAAVAIDAAAQAQAKAAGASSSTINAIANAGNTLQTTIKNSSSATQKAVASAYAQFNDSVETAIKNDSSLNGSAFATVNTSIGASGGLKSTFESKISASSDVSSMIQAYSDFTSSVKSMVQSNFTSAGSSKVMAYTRLLVLINLAS
ncbi:MAG TPA: hypothetical protein VE868_10995 [Balneolaceae bacterium]|nr:hypothetical protein [Balneolaceae bacterium]